MKNRIVCLSTQCGDWEALYVNGTLISERHRLAEGNSKQFWFSMYKKYDFEPKDIEYKELNDVDEDFAMDYGSFHKELSDFNGKY